MLIELIFKFLTIFQFPFFLLIIKDVLNIVNLDLRNIEAHDLIFTFFFSSLFTSNGHAEHFLLFRFITENVRFYFRFGGFLPSHWTFLLNNVFFITVISHVIVTLFYTTVVPQQLTNWAICNLAGLFQ